MRIKKITKHESFSLLIMIIISCITQLLTIMKTSMVAGFFGTTSEMDAFNFANSIITFIIGFISTGISTVVIPKYVHKEDTKDVNSFITVIYIIVFAVIGICIIGRVQLISLISNKDDYFVYLCASLLLILSLTNMLLSVTFITAAHFQCRGKYNIPKIINLISQLMVVLSLLFVKDITIYQYTYLFAGGILLNFLLDIAMAIKTGWKFHISFDIKNNETKKLFKLFLPVVFSSGIYQLSLLIDSSIASRLESGLITILGYSSQIATMINTLIIGNMIIYIYPKIVKRVTEKNNQEEFWDTVSLFHCIVCFIIVGFFSAGKEAIAVLFQHGKFDGHAASSVFLGAMIYILGQQTNIIRDLIYRYFYSTGDTKTPAHNSIIVSAVNIISSIIMVKIIGFYGIIIGTVLASFVSLCVIFREFGKKIGYAVKISKIASPILVNLLGVAVTCVVVSGVRALLGINSYIVRGLICGITAVGIYAIYTFLLNKKILTTLKNI